MLRMGMVREWARKRSGPLLIIVLGMTGAGCAPRRLNVMYTPQQTLMTTGYASERDGSILAAQHEAQRFCERQGRYVVAIKQDTVYQGSYDEQLSTVMKTAGRVAGIAGSPEGARAGRVLSAPTDYKTSFEFRCQ